MTKIIYAAPVAMMLAACASSNSDRYMAANEEGDFGYYESEIEDNRYRVAYKVRGNDVSDAKDLALLRAAELTLQEGYEWFEVVDRDSQREERSNHARAVMSMQMQATTYRECNALRCRTVTRPSYIDPTYRDRIPAGVESTATIIEVVMGDGEMPDDSNVYDAKALTRTIGDNT